MRGNIRAKPRLLVAGVFAAALALPGPVLAQIAYSGYTNGCFGVGCIPVNTSTFQFAEIVKPNSTLRYVNSQFSGVVNEGDVFILNNAANGRFVQEVNNIGAFYLTMGNTNADTYSDVFTLAIRWVDPGTGLSVFTASLTGTIRVGQPSPNSVVIDFANDSDSFTWSNLITGEKGTVDFHITPRQTVIAGNLNQTSSGRLILEGTITTVPEPISMVLVGSGLLGVAGAARRRKRAQVDESGSI